MKKLFTALMGIFASLISFTAAAQSAPLPESCSLNFRPFTCPLEWIGFSFDGGIRLLDGASAVVKCDGEIVASSINMEIRNDTYKRTQGHLNIYFEKQNLPKGKDYTVVVAPSSIAAEADGTENPEFSYDFFVPENLGPMHTDEEDGMVIDKVCDSVFHAFPTFLWGIETEAAGEPKFNLYREDVKVREFPAKVGWDWDLGQAYADVKEEIRFEKGVNYKLVLPAGSAHAMYRDDIVNEEAVFNFVGGYEEPIPPLNYVWCSLYTDHSHAFNVVSFYYDRPVRVTEGAKLQLWEERPENDDWKVIKEAEAYLEVTEDRWVVSADFGGHEMELWVGYSVVIPEGAVVADDGDPVINQRSAVAVGDHSGIDGIGAEGSGENAVLYDLFGRKVTNPVPGTIYISNGRKVICK